MDFFSRQDNARRKTKWLVLYFSLAVIGIVATIYFIVAVIFLRPGFETYGSANFWLRLCNPLLFLRVTLPPLCVSIIGSLSKIAELRQGGSAIAESLGGRPLDPNTPNLDEKKFLNVVEEMAIASGTPVPQVFLLPREQGIN